MSTITFTSKSYNKKLANKFVEAELYTNPDKPNDVGILVNASDNSKLTSQEIIDVVADLLLIHYDKVLNNAVIN